MFSSGNDKYSTTTKAKALRRIQKKIWKGTRKRTIRQESEVVTRMLLKQKEEELSQVKAAKTIEMERLRGAIQYAKEKEIARLAKIKDKTVLGLKSSVDNMMVKEIRAITAAVKQTNHTAKDQTSIRWELGYIIFK
jgi:hypothetical protein